VRPNCGGSWWAAPVSTLQLSNGGDREVGEQVVYACVEGSGEADDDAKAGGFEAAFHFADEVGAQAGLFAIFPSRAEAQLKRVALCRNVRDHGHHDGSYQAMSGRRRLCSR
jgi:hypothetical protein